MINTQSNQIQTVLGHLFEDSKYDRLKMIKSFSKTIFRPIEPTDFENIYLSISKQQGEDLVQIVKKNNLKNIVEFGTSFGISTLYLALGAMEIGGEIITTELIESKAKKAIRNFKDAKVDHIIEVRIGDAMSTLSEHNSPIDLLLLDGWKDLYSPLFDMLKPNFHKDTIVYVDNADMADTQEFLKQLSYDLSYKFQYLHNGKVVLISMKN